MMFQMFSSDAIFFAIINLLVYFTPLYLFVVKVWSEKLHFKDWMDTIANRLFLSITSILITVFVLMNNVWFGQQLFVPIFYTFWFIVFLYKLPKWLGGWDSFLIATLSIFAISEVWELPIISRNLFQHDLLWISQNLVLSSLKLVSIPILYFIVKQVNQDGKYFEWKKHKAFDIMFLISIVFLSIASFVGVETFVTGIYIRMVIASLFYVFILGFREVTQ